MRNDLGAKPILYPMPVLILGTYDENGNPNAMNAAWGGISDYEEITVSISAGHKTAANVLKTKAFTVSPADVKNLVAADYVGVVSGNKEPDKIKKAGWTVTKSNKVNAPVFNELPLTLECEMLSYDPETDRLVGKIVNVSADATILTDGKIDLTKFRPISYDPSEHGYYTLGERIGNAFADGKQLNK